MDDRFNATRRSATVAACAHLAGVGAAGALALAFLPSHPNDSDVPRSGSDSPAGHYAASGERAHYPGAGADADTLPALAYRNPQPRRTAGRRRSRRRVHWIRSVGPRPRREHFVAPVSIAGGPPGSGGTRPGGPAGAHPLGRTRRTPARHGERALRPRRTAPSDRHARPAPLVHLHRALRGPWPSWHKHSSVQRHGRQTPPGPATSSAVRWAACTSAPAAPSRCRAGSSAPRSRSARRRRLCERSCLPASTRTRRPRQEPPYRPRPRAPSTQGRSSASPHRSGRPPVLGRRGGSVGAPAALGYLFLALLVASLFGLAVFVVRFIRSPST